MGALSEEDKVLLGPAISPFERSRKADRLRVLREGEDRKEEFQNLIHDAIDNDRPSRSYVEVTLAEVEGQIRKEGTHKEKSFLWVIDDTSIKMIREKTHNPWRTHDTEYVCHTNLTGGTKAFLGGELFFCEDGNIYISPKSDRYGWPTPEQWQAALGYFRRVGYVNLVDIWEWLIQGK